eukprot:767676-Prymnesium_polylepis.1
MDIRHDMPDHTRPKMIPIWQQSDCLEPLGHPLAAELDPKPMVTTIKRRFDDKRPRPRLWRLTAVPPLWL